MAMKERLQDYIDLNREIDYQTSRLERFDDKMCSIGVPVYNDSPRNPSPDYDRLSNMVARKESIENTIRELAQKRDTEREELERLIARLEKPKFRMVLRLRYLDLEEWEDVHFIMFGDKDDYSENYDNYKQNIFRWHRAAIKELDAIANSEEVTA